MFISGLSILFHGSVCLFLCQYHAFLITITQKSLGHNESHAKREIHGITGLLQVQEKSQVNSLPLYSKELRKEQQSPAWI